ncbi:hypothetical protein OLZ33_19510 [Pantoea ananatis]|uniref:hypothetical protein n=1 Tax=Pantoea ananas TaxID=553 RepID=UPI001FF0B990|nr:hypothetical protein [Pantoea ananatis]MCW1834170.1 hypothetical protein [Pantoea ananatis]
MLKKIAKEEAEKINEVLKILFKISLIIGGLVMISYCYFINFFPYDLSIGDGLLFIGLALSFGIIYLFLITLFSCVGFKLRGLLIVITKSITKIKRMEKYEEDLFSLIPKRTEMVLWFPAMLGWFIIIKLASPNNISKTITSLFILIFLSWLSAHCISSYWEIKKEEFSNPEVPKKNSTQLKLIYLIVFLIFPLLSEGVLSTMSTGAMRLMKIRQDLVTVHISNPYVQFAIEAGAKG